MQRGAGGGCSSALALAHRVGVCGVRLEEAAVVADELLPRVVGQGDEAVVDPHERQVVDVVVREAEANALEGVHGLEEQGGQLLLCLLARV